MLPKKIAACALALSVLVSPLSAQTVKVEAAPALAGSGLGAAGGAPSIRLSDFALASGLTPGVSLAPALAAPAPLSAAAVQPKIPVQAVAAVQPVAAVPLAAAPKPILARAFDAVKRTAGSMFSRKGDAASKRVALGDGSRFFDGARRFLAAAAVGATLVLAGCSKAEDPVPTYPDAPAKLDDRPESAVAAATMLNQNYDASEAFAAHLGYNTWDQEYHLGAPHRNSYDISGAHYGDPQKLSFDSAAAQLGTMRVDQAVGSKLVYIDGAWTLIPDDYPSNFWVSRWITAPGLTSELDALSELNRYLTPDQAYDAKVTAGDDGIFRVTYPEKPLSLSHYKNWTIGRFDTFLEATTWAQVYLNASQNRGAKIFFSPYEVAYFVIYPLENTDL